MSHANHHADLRRFLPTSLLLLAVSVSPVSAAGPSADSVIPWLVRGEVVRQPAPADLDRAVAAYGRTDAEWIGWSVPQQPGTGDSCCGTFEGTRRLRRGCSLDGARGVNIEGVMSIDGTVEATPAAGREGPLTVFLRIREGRVAEVRPLSASCPVDAGERQVRWLEPVATPASVAFFDRLVRAGGEVGEGALTALALHAGTDADRALGALARRPGEAAEQVWFWLGDARGEPGFTVLQALAGELPGEDREELTFAISRSGARDARPLLRRMARRDPAGDVRAQAMFWLAEVEDPEALATIRRALREDPDPDVREQAVFALSQLPGAGSELLAVVRDRGLPVEVRQQAVFWLAQSEDPEAAQAVDALLDAH